MDNYWIWWTKLYTWCSCCWTINLVIWMAELIFWYADLWIVVCLLALLIICCSFIYRGFRAEEYGIVGLVYAAIALLNLLFTMGMESRIYAIRKDREQSANLFKTLQLFLLVLLYFLGALWLLAPFITPELGIETSKIFIGSWLVFFSDTLPLYLLLNFVCRKAAV